MSCLFDSRNYVAQACAYFKLLMPSLSVDIDELGEFGGYQGRSLHWLMPKTN